jgi:hypothetical protein
VNQDRKNTTLKNLSKNKAISFLLNSMPRLFPMLATQQTINGAKMIFGLVVLTTK